jgi:hypothetical protein
VRAVPADLRRRARRTLIDTSFDASSVLTRLPW